MRVRRTMASVAASALIAGGALLAAAPAAHAATDLGRVDFDCTDNTDIYGALPIDGSTVYVSGVVGDTFVIDQDDSIDCPILTGSGQAVNTIDQLGFVSETDAEDSLYTDPLRYADSITVEYLIQCSGTFRILAEDDSYYTIVVTAADCSGRSTSVPNWLQAYGRFSGDTCQDGWSPSWQEWAIDVTGGLVCTRNVPSRG